MARLLALLLLVAGAAFASADYCTYFSTYAGTTCSVYLVSGQYIQAGTCSTLLSGASGYGDTVVTITNQATGIQLASNDDAGSSCTAGSALSNIPATTLVPTTGYYTIQGRCYSSTSTCYGTVAYSISSSSTPTCSSRTCSSCMTTSGCGWCAYSSSYGSSGYCTTTSTACSYYFYSYAYYGSYVCTASSSSSYNSGGYYSGYYGSDVSNKGWVAPAILTAVTGITMITLTSVFGALLCSECACCGCAPTAADKRQPSVLDSPVGSMHWHTFAVCVMLPIAAILVFVALCVDAYTQDRDDRSIMWGAFSEHQRSNKVTYNDFCASFGASNGNTNSIDRMCPSLRAAGAMTFIANVLSLGVAVGALLKFAASAPYAVAAKPAMSGGKPVIPLLACRLIVLYMVLNSTAVIMWLVGGHSSLVWAAQYNSNDGNAEQLGVSWALMFVSMIISIPGTAIARREAVREQPKAANQQNAVAGQNPQQPMQSVAPMQPMGVNMGFGQQPYGGAPYGGQPAPVYGQQPVYGQPMQNQQPMPMQQPGYAPQYGAQQPVVVVNAPPPAYGVPQQQMPMPMQQPVAVVRVPVVPPAGLALPPGAILYSNGDVCDASGNVLGVVPGMQQQNGAQVVMAGTA